MEIINRDGGRWPDPELGPFNLWTTFAIVDGRAEVVGVELWAVDPASLEKRVTHLSKAQAREHWPRLDDPEWDSREGVIRSNDLRLPLGRIVTDYMERQRRLARADQHPDFKEKVLNDAKRFGLVSPDYKPLPTNPKRQEATRRILELEDDSAPRKPGRPSLPLSEYLRVAEIYVRACENRLDPLQEISNFAEKEMSKSSAGKMIFKCRNVYGLLTKTTRGRSGGTLTEKALQLRNEIDASKSKGEN